VTTASSATVPAGDVISQNPTACTACAVAGDPVDLVVSSGPAPALIDVPNVVGMTQASAEAAIVAAGLSVGTVTTASSSTVPAGDVISQNPAACTACANSGDPVNLVVSSGPPTGGGDGVSGSGNWKNNPDDWPLDPITVGGVTYSAATAASMFQHLTAAMLNVADGNESSCIASTISDANQWLIDNPLGSDVRANSAAWKEGAPLKNMLEAYNKGLLCAPSE